LEWYWLLLLMVGVLVLFLISGIPVGFAFLLMNIGAMLVLVGGTAGIEQVILNIKSGLASFTLLPLPLFILMGDVIFNSGIAPKMLDAVDNWIGRLPGRLSLIAILGGTILSTLTGSSAASVAMLGSTLVPEMRKRGYSKEMSLGPILGSGALAAMIPPSSMAVLIGAVGQIDVGKILIAIIIPGLLMAVLYCVWVIVRCMAKPSLAPVYEVSGLPVSAKLMASVKYILPLALIVFLVLGVIFLGWATPTEAAATGALGTFILAFAYKGLTWTSFKKTMTSTIRSTGLVLFIIMGASAFSYVLAYSGAARHLTQWVTGLEIAPILIIILILLVNLFLGMFMGSASIVLLTIPIFAPVVMALHFDPVWFAVLYIIGLEVGQITPPYGLSVFIMQATAGGDTTIADCFKGASMYIVLEILAMVIVLLIPAIALWLPSLM
jgi:tripartite ATP-independent transporter DctM subunit